MKMHACFYFHKALLKNRAVLLENKAVWLANTAMQITCETIFKTSLTLKSACDF